MTNSGRNLNTKNKTKNKTRMYHCLTKETEPWAPTSFNWQVRMNVSDESQAACMMNAKASAWVLCCCFFSAWFLYVSLPFTLSFYRLCRLVIERMSCINSMMCVHTLTLLHSAGWMDGWHSNVCENRHDNNLCSAIIIVLAVPSIVACCWAAYLDVHFYSQPPPIIANEGDPPTSFL